jgi:hypothetical protein
MEKNKLLEKILNHAMKLYFVAVKDRLLYGSSNIEFGERSMIVIDNLKVVESINKVNKEVYGESPIKNISEIIKKKVEGSISNLYKQDE